MSGKKTDWAEDFYSYVEPIIVRDPLAELLGAVTKGGTIAYDYTDAVKVAGHSCPAVSGAFTLTKLALKALYKDEVPVRGEIRVLLKGGARDLAYGPQSQVISLITGAAGETGFKGLGKRFGRCDKLKFDSGDTQFNTFIFERIDTNDAVWVVYNPGALPPDEELNRLSPLAISGSATEKEMQDFHAKWQAKIQKILMEHEKYEGLFEVQELNDFKFPE